jgi:predicted MFS family arabinose efflux permease
VNRILLIALGSSFLQQTFVSIGKVLPAVLAPVIVAELAYDPSWVGIYFGLTSVFALLAQMGCGSFIMRYGPLRMSQVALAMLAVGMICMTGDWKVFFFLSALIGGAGAAISTPTSSQLLGKMSPPRLAPLMFSIRQTGVPMGLLLGGAFGPTLALSLGWRGTVIASALACLAFVLLLQPLRPLFDIDLVPSRRFKVSDFKTTFRSVIKDPGLRGLSFACFAFNGMQQVMTSYFVIYLTSIGYDLVAAGYIFSTAVAVAIPGRIAWGWLGSFHVAPRLVMAGIALGIAVGATGLGFFNGHWPLAAIGLVSALLSLTALSWHGILLSESARLAPLGMTGAVAGGVLSFGQMGALLGPVVYAALLRTTGSYGIGFVVCGLPSLFVGVNLLRQKTA